MVDRLTAKVEKAKKVAEEKRKKIEKGEGYDVDVTSMSFAASLAFIILALFLICLAVRHLL